MACPPSTMSLYTYTKFFLIVTSTLLTESRFQTDYAKATCRLFPSFKDTFSFCLLQMKSSSARSLLAAHVSTHRTSHRVSLLSGIVYGMFLLDKKNFEGVHVTKHHNVWEYGTCSTIFEALEEVQRGVVTHVLPNAPRRHAQRIFTHKISQTTQHQELDHVFSSFFITKLN